MWREATLDAVLLIGKGWLHIVPITHQDGWLEVPIVPGLGIEVDEDSVKKYQFHNWHRKYLAR